MSHANIRKCFEKRLALMSPALATQPEGTEYTPTIGTPFQKTYLLPADPDNASLGDGYYREVGLYQITLRYPPNKGAGDAEARAEAIKTHFKRGTSMTENSQTVLVTRTPAIAPAFMEGERYCVPVSIYYRSEVFN
jgi:hypothetical protein